MTRDVASLHDSKRDSARSPSRVLTSAAHARPETNTHLNYIVGPNGDIITLADLPSPQTTRWVIRRKAEVVFAVHGGLLSLEDACARYQLTAEEFRAWQSAIEHHGLLGLRSTHLQDYRHSDKSQIQRSFVGISPSAKEAELRPRYLEGDIQGLPQ